MRADAADYLPEGMELSMNAKLRGDEGFLLVEVLVSAALLLMVSAAVFLTLDNADSQAGNQQRRTIAANVAQGELERLRSQPIEEVAKLTTAKTIVREHGGIDYTINLKSKWLSDGGGDTELKCASRNGGLDYLRATATVSWQGMKTAKPQTITTLVTPRGGAGDENNGSLSVMIVGRDGVTGKSGITVSLQGTKTYTETTNANGCVVFPFIPISNNYTLRFNRTGMVDINGVQAVEETVSVTPNATNKLEFMYDSAGTTAFSFRTWRAGQSGEPSIPTRPGEASLFAAQQPQATVVPLGTNDTWDDPSKGFFPFLTAYTIYAGACDKAVPAYNSRGVNIVPAQRRPAGVIPVPSVDYEVWSGDGRTGWGAVGDGSLVDGARVKVTTSCGATYTRITGDTVSGIAAPNVGRLADPGFPYSVGAGICISGRGSNGTNYRVNFTDDITNMNGGGNVERIYLRRTGATTGSC